MQFSTLTTLLLAAVSWQSVQAGFTLEKRAGIVRGTQNGCTPRNELCTRVAVASVTGSQGVSGYFQFISAYKSSEVKVIYRITGLDTYKSDVFTYHVHTNPVGPNNDCAATLEHLNPVRLPETEVCEPQNLATCEVGDLSGKHGKLFPGKSVERSYIDSQLRFDNPAYSMVGRSVVIHDAQKNRIACGNVILGSKMAP